MPSNSKWRVVCGACGVCLCRQLIEENDGLKLEVQGLRSLMQGFAAGMQPPGSSQPPGSFRVSTPYLPCGHVSLP